MELKLGHDIKIKVGEKQKNIRPSSTYLFRVEGKERRPEVEVGGHRWGCPPLPLVNWSPSSSRPGLQKVDT